MGYDFFLMPFFVSFAIAAVLLAVFIWLNKKWTFCETRKSARHIHHLGISRFGGIALVVAFIATILLDGRLVIAPELFAVLVALLAILIFGVLDDIKQLSWKIQLFFQMAVVSFVYMAGVRLDYISNPFGGIFLFHDYGGFIIGFIIVVAWAVLLMNSMNWIDGIDGISSGISLIGGATIFLLSLRPEVNQPPIGIISAAFMGGLLAFLLFNFHPAKILAGTSGSMFMGFVLAVLAIFAGAKIATTLLVLAVPIIDALWVIGERFQSKKLIFSADRRHLHYRLLELGWSPKKICIFYYAITALIAVLALNTRAVGKTITFVLFGIVMLTMLVLIRNKVSQKA